jgi:hypothetical protein
MLADPLSFPQELPPTYQPLTDEPAFDPARHLALERPRQVWQLAELGYTPAQIEACASEVAVAGPLRLLSEEGVAAARAVALSLRAHCLTSDRTARYLAGGVYRSRFLRDLCNCAPVTAFLSEIVGCELLPHSMPSQQIYINYAPEDGTRAVDTWHVDSIGFDYVLLLNDPRTLSGGDFQFFRGTIEQAAQLLETAPEGLTEANARDLPPDRVVTASFPAAGYALLQQGNLIVHRATALTRPGERITLVPGLVARDLRWPDPTRDAVIGWGEPGIVAEYARHKAWLARAKLDELIARMRPDASPAEIRAGLERAVADVLHAVARLNDGTD